MNSDNVLGIASTERCVKNFVYAAQHPFSVLFEY
jgi:hypothetical protein